MSEVRSPVNATAASLVSSLAVFSLLDVLDLLARTGRTGELQVVSSGTDLRLWVDEGHLLDEGEAPEGDEATPGVEAGHPITGSAGGLSSDGQQSELFQSACAEQGWLYFTDGAPLPADTRRRPLDSVLAELGPAVSEWRELVADLPFTAILRLADATPADEVQIRAGEWQLLSKLGNQPGRSVQQLIDAAGGDPLALLRTLRGLLRAGLVEVEVPPVEVPVVSTSQAAVGTTGHSAAPAARSPGSGAPAPAADSSSIQWAPPSTNIDAPPPDAPPSNPVRSGEQLPPFFPVGDAGPAGPAGWSPPEVPGATAAPPGQDGAAGAPAAGAPPSSVMPPPITGDPWSASLVDR